MVVSSNSDVGVVRTTIVHPTMVGGLETSLYGYPKSPWGDDMSVVSKALSVEKCLPSKGGGSSRFTIFCPVAIGLVNRMNKHYIHAGPFRGPEFFFFFFFLSHLNLIVTFEPYVIFF